MFVFLLSSVGVRLEAGSLCLPRVKSVKAGGLREAGAMHRAPEIHRRGILFRWGRKTVLGSLSCALVTAAWYSLVVPLSSVTMVGEERWERSRWGALAELPVFSVSLSLPRYCVRVFWWRLPRR